MYLYEKFYLAVLLASLLAVEGPKTIYNAMRKVVAYFQFSNELKQQCCLHLFVNGKKKANCNRPETTFKT